MAVAPKRISKAQIAKGFSDNIGRLAKTISKGRRNEDETRRWVIDVLKDGLGYSEDDIETECAILGKRVDIALSHNDKIFAVIECKAANVSLKQTAINQAANYALALGAEWAITTNGQAWGLYHVEQAKASEPEIIEVFYIELLDEDGISKEDVDMLSLLTKKSILSGDTDENFNLMRILQPKNLYNAILSDSSINTICKELLKQYKKRYKIEFEDGVLNKEDVKEIIESYLQDMLD